MFLSAIVKAGIFSSTQAGVVLSESTREDLCVIPERARKYKTRLQKDNDFISAALCAVCERALFAIAANVETTLSIT